MSSAKPASSALASASAAGAPKKKLTRKQQEEEDERLAREAAAAAAAALAAIPPSPFERIQEVWALDGKPREQRALVGEIFGVEDGPGICIQSLTLDDTYSHLHFARSAGFNVEQTKAFFEIMINLREQLSSPTIEGNAGLEQAFAAFKTAVMANAAVVRGKQPPTAAAVASPAMSSSVSGASLASPTASGRPGSTSGVRPGSSSSKGGSVPQPISVDAPPRPGSRGGSAAKAGTSSPSSSSRSSATGALGSPTNASAAAGAKSTPRGSAAIAAAAAAAEEAAAAEAAAAEAAAVAAALPSRAFSLDNIRAITSYATSGIFQHYTLYQAVFNAQRFKPRKHTVVERLRIETVIPDAYPSLEWAVELGAVRAQQQQQQAQLQQQAEESKQKAQADRERKEESKDGGGGGVQRWTADGSSRPASAAFTDARSISRMDGGLGGGGSEDADEIGALVRQHMQKARAQMLALIQDNDKLLDAKLRAVEQKVGVGAAAAATTTAHSTTKSSSSAKKR